MQYIMHTKLIHSESRKAYIFLPPVQHNSRPLRSIDQSTIYTDYKWIMCATFGVCLQFLTLIVFEISEEKKIGKLEKCQKLHLFE